MAQVDPRLQQIPKQFLTDFDMRNYFEDLERFLHDLWVRTGGGNDAIADTDIQEKYPWPMPSPASQDFDQARYSIPAEVIKFRSVSTASDYTATDNDFVNAKNSATVTLPLYPDENSVIIVRNGDGSNITISGNGKNVSGFTTARTRRKGTALTLQFFPDENEWFPR